MEDNQIILIFIIDGIIIFLLMISGFGQPSPETIEDAQRYIKENFNWQDCEPELISINPFYPRYFECCNITNSIRNCQTYYLDEWDNKNYVFQKYD